MLAHLDLIEHLLVARLIVDLVKLVEHPLVLKQLFLLLSLLEELAANLTV